MTAGRHPLVDMIGAMDDVIRAAVPGFAALFPLTPEERARRDEYRRRLLAAAEAVRRRQRAEDLARFRANQLDVEVERARLEALGRRIAQLRQAACNCR